MNKQDFNALTLPDSPGVYFFMDEQGEILYIGKATSLHDRVKSYFSTDLEKTRGLRLVTMRTLARTVTHQATDSVLEALLLESLLIKKHTPLYNTKEKDDTSFLCVVITKEAFPRVLTMRIRDYEKRFTKKDVRSVYGPFASGTQLKVAITLIRRMFPFRDTCNPEDGKPCFNAKIGLCPGVCTGALSSKEYVKTITYVEAFFSGKKESIRAKLDKEMKAASKGQHFEQAAKIRDTLYAIDHIKDTALIKDEEIGQFKSTARRIEAYDVAHISGTSRAGVMVVVEDGKAKKEEYKLFKLPEQINDDYAGLREILSRRLAHKEWRYPDIIVFDGGKAQKEAGESVLASHKILIPTVSVVKDNRHKPKDILGTKDIVDNHTKEILFANAEAHRFAINYHKKLRHKALKLVG